jgi:hypothetical protein
MQITIDLPDNTVRKIRALAVLAPELAENIESALSQLVDMSATNAIVQILGLAGADAVTDQSKPAEAPRPKTRYPESREGARAWNHAADVSGISDGLGDDEEPEATINPPAGMAAALKSQKAAGGITYEDLDRDMDVDDPGHEAKSEAPNFYDAVSTPEAAFTAVAGLPDIGNNHFDARAARRKKPLKSRAKITAFTGNEASSF